jgi:hypothetical protein
MTKPLRIFVLTKAEQRVVIVIVILLLAAAIAKRYYDKVDSVASPVLSPTPAQTASPNED